MALVPAAIAGPTEDEAKAAAKRGAAAYNLGSYEEAARQYETSYRLVQNPVLLFNIGQSWRLAGQPEKALVAYRSYLRTAPPDAENRDLVKRRVEELDRQAAAKPREPAPQATPPLAKDKPASGPASDPAVAPAGPSATALAPALPTSVPRDDGQSVEAKAAEEQPAFYQRWWFWTGAAAAVATIVVVGMLSSGDYRSASCGPSVDTCQPILP